MIHRYAFILKNNNISAWTYDEMRDLFEPLTDKGERVFPLRTDYEAFWNWWEERTSFITEEDQVDFHFIYDTLPDEFKKHPFTQVKESQWKEEQLEALVKYALKGDKGQLKNGFSEKKPVAAKPQKENKKVVGLVADSKAVKETKVKVIGKEQISQSQSISPLARLFVQQMTLERNHS